LDSPEVHVDAEIRSELEAALTANRGQLGETFRLLQTGVTSNRDLIEAGAAANFGAVGNLRVAIEAILDGRLPQAPSRAQQTRRSIGGILRDNPELSDSATRYLNALRDRLETIENDATRIEAEDAELERASREVEQAAEDQPGVYVFTLPSFRRVSQKEDPVRYWFKVGKTDRTAGIRIGEIRRATGLPEDPWLARLYTHPTHSPAELERAFHRLLEAAGHGRPSGRNNGLDWFATNLEFLDAIAGALGCDTIAGKTTGG
jgi:hypothetical protein